MDIIVPELALRISAHVSTGNVSPLKAYLQSPTLAQLRFVCRFVKEHMIPFYSERGEWTADFVNMDVSWKSQEQLPEGYLHVLYVSKPQSIQRIGDSWVAYGGQQQFVTLPPNGWVIPDKHGKLYDESTGLPLQTTPLLEQAEASNYAYFWRGEYGQGLLAVNRECERIQSDAFEISIVQSPDFTHENIGFRELKGG